MAPEPLIRTRLVPPARSSAASTSAITGCRAMAAAVMSLRSRSSGRAGSMGPRSRWSQPANTGPVATATRGLTSKTGVPAGSWGQAESASPLPAPKRVWLYTHTGTSAPKGSANVASRSSGQLRPHSRFSNRSAAAASAEPPPRPAATGIRFSRVTAAPGTIPAAAASAQPARSTRLSASGPAAAAVGPESVSVSVSAGAAWSVSPKSVKAKMLSRS